LHLCICAKSNEEKKERKRVKTWNSGKNYLPTFFWYETGCIENDTSNNSAVPR
jgi:hypothetical protein